MTNEIKKKIIKGEDVAQLVEGLPSVHNSLGSIPTTTESGSGEFLKFQHCRGGELKIEGHPYLHGESRASRLGL